MLLIALASATLTIGSEAGQNLVRYSDTWFCRAALPNVDGWRTSVALEVDRNHRPLGTNVLMSRSGWWFRWRVEGASAAITKVEPRTAMLPSDAEFPVVATLLFSNRAVWQREYARRTVNVMDFNVMSAHDAPRPGVEVEIDGPQVPLPIGEEDVAVVVTARTGAEIARQTLTFPDWGRMHGGLAAAFASVELHRQLYGCRPMMNVTIVD